MRRILFLFLLPFTALEGLSASSYPRFLEQAIPAASLFSGYGVTLDESHPRAAAIQDLHLSRSVSDAAELSRRIALALGLFPTPFLTESAAYQDRSYAAEQWGRNGREEYGKSFIRVGPLFFIDQTLAAALSEPLRRELGNRLILIENMEDSSLALYSHFTISAIIGMLQLDFRDKRVVDVGAGDGVLALVAARLGATSCVTVENDAAFRERARRNFEHNGLASRLVVLQRHDMKETESLAQDINALEPQDTILVANVGTFPTDYDVSNEQPIALAGQLANTRSVVLSGYVLGNGERAAAIPSIHQQEWLNILKTDLYGAEKQGLTARKDLISWPDFEITYVAWIADRDPGEHSPARLFQRIAKEMPNAMAAAFHQGWVPKGGAEHFTPDAEFLMATIQRELRTGIPFPALSLQMLQKLWDADRVLSADDIRARIVGIDPPAAEVVARALTLCHNPFYWIGHVPEARAWAYFGSNRAMKSALSRFRQQTGLTIEAYFQAATYEDMGHISRWWERTGETVYRELQTRLEFRGADFSELPILRDPTFIALCHREGLWSANTRLAPKRLGLSVDVIRALERNGIFSTDDMANIRFTPQARLLKLVQAQLNRPGPVTPKAGLWRPPKPPKAPDAIPVKKTAKPAAGAKPANTEKIPSAHIVYALPGIIIQEIAALPTTADFISRIRQAMLLYARHKWPILQARLEGPVDALQPQAGYAFAIINPATFIVESWVDVSATSKELLGKHLRYALINVLQAVEDGRIAEPALKHAIVTTAA